MLHWFIDQTCMLCNLDVLQVGTLVQNAKYKQPQREFFLMLFFSSAHTWMLWHSWGSVTYMVKPWGGVLVVTAWWPEHWQLSSQEGPRVWFPVTDNVLLSFYSGYLQLQFLLQHRTMTYNLDNRRRERKGAKDRAVSRLLWRYLSVGRAKNGNL